MQQTDHAVDLHTRREICQTAQSANSYRTNSFCPFSDAGAFPWHWHPEGECFCLQKGALVYPRRECLLAEGDVGLVNTDVLHMLSDGSGSACQVQNHIFLPQLLCENNRVIETKHIAPLVCNAAAPCCAFRPKRRKPAKSASGWRKRAAPL